MISIHAEWLQISEAGWKQTIQFEIVFKSVACLSTQFRLKESFELLFAIKLRKFGDKSRNSLATKNFLVLAGLAGEYRPLNWPITVRVLT